MANEERIVELTSLPVEGSKYVESKDARSVRAEFTRPGDRPLIVDKQGVRRISLSDKCMVAVVHIVKYLICEGRQYFLHSIHFKFLSHLGHGMRMNVPNVLYNLLSVMASETQKGRSNSISHHCLIKLLVE